MEPTIKLYDEDAYNTAFQGKVVDCREEKEGVGLYLDATLFFPEEGGQYPDAGNIDRYPVADVQIQNNVICHTIKGNTEELMNYFTVGKVVAGEIDFARRYDFMQQHSGEHVLTGLIYNTFGYANVGFHLSEEIVTMDVGGPLTREQLEEMELKANEIIVSNRRITAQYPDAETLKNTNYRSKIEIDGAVRLVTIEDHDICACCAPHVRATGEIGQIHIVKAEKYKGGMRLEIKCGKRAIRHAIKSRETISQLSAMLSANAESLVEAVSRLQQELSFQKGRVAKMQEDKLNGLLEEVQEEGNQVLFLEDVDANAVRNLVNQMMEKTAGVAAAFVKIEEDIYRYIIGSRTKDVTTFQAVLKAEGNAKGGGNAKMIQGTVYANEEKIKKILNLD